MEALARRIAISERDRELDGLLVRALDRLEGRASREGAPLFAPILRYGATLDLDPEYAEDELFAPYLVPSSSDASGLVAVLDESQQLDEALHADHFEYAHPGDDWSERHKALFWRVLARIHERRYSDALLNLTARALEQAIPWHVVNDPGIALDMLLWRARALSYASYGDKDVLPCIDDAARLWSTVTLPADKEYALAVQACEALHRVRAGHTRTRPRTRELLAIGIRGLELAATLDAAPQSSRIHHAVADALIDTADEAIDDRLRRVATTTYGSGPRLAWAETAWRRAIDLEDGDFYGEKTASRRAERIAQYQRELAILAFARGEEREALDGLLAIAPADSLYGRLQWTKATLRRLSARNVDGTTRTEYLRASLERDTRESDAKTEFDHEMIADYAAFAAYQFANLGAGREPIDLVARIRGREKVADAARRRAERDAESKQRTEKSTRGLLDALFARLAPPDESPEERARRLEARRRAETPEQRAYRVGDEVVREALESRRMDLLIDVGRFVTEKGARVTLVFEVNCAEYALEVVLRDPVVRDAIDSITTRVREGLPDARVEALVASLLLEPLVGVAGGTARALTHAGATEALAGLGLSPVEADEANLDDVLRDQRDARTKLRVGGWVDVPEV